MAKITFPIGPQHPALKEPESFKITAEGECVVDVDIRLGYVHRSIEAACLARNYVQGQYVCERICGICSHIHSNTFARAVEDLLQLEVPARAKYLRVLVAELERIHSHLLWLGVAAHEVGFDTLFMYVWRDREVVQDLLEMITGNRVHYGFTTIGGTKFDLTPQMADKCTEGLMVLRERTEYYKQVATTESSFLKRVEGVGVLTEQQARELGAVGPTARASNVPYDARWVFPYDAYPELDYQPITSDLGDVLGRTIVRVLETFQAIDICEEVLRRLPEGDIQVRAKPRVPEGETVARCEAPRGEVFYYIRSNGTDKPARVKVRTPSLANWPATIAMLEGAYVADAPIIIASIDPCMSCTDR
ncbi:MAG TPA: NADH dehydrogenase subunit [Armatimonadetes bacterium]|jgi:NADH-quinone oxidoreductase subunit D|nr:NADH dehydrogenase subunit [Armatimonadota bacterium]